MYLKEKTKVSESKDITTDTIIKCLKLVDYSCDTNINTPHKNMGNEETKPSTAKNLKFKLFILIYITQNGSILKQVDELNILPFLLRAYTAHSKSSHNKNANDGNDDVILSILANMSFEEKLREKIINFKKLSDILDKIHRKKRDVLRLLANLTLSRNFDVEIILDK